MKTTSITGSPAASTASLPPRLQPCNTQVRLITLRDLRTCIPMALFQAAALMDTGGGRLARDSAGRRSLTGNGSRIPALALLGSAISHGVGLPITTVDGSLIPPAAAGFIPPRFSTDTLGILSVREGVPAAFIPRALSIIQ